MRSISICQIVDYLSKSVVHTFMASGDEHAVRQFQAFLKSLEGKIHNGDFYLILSCRSALVPDSFAEADTFICTHPDDVYRGDEVMKDES